MTKSLFSLSLCVGFLLAQNSCPIVIEDVKQNSDSYTLVLKYSSKCEILMEHNTSHISLISKPYEEEGAASRYQWQ